MLSAPDRRHLPVRPRKWDHSCSSCAGATRCAASTSSTVKPAVSASASTRVDERAQPAFALAWRMGLARGGADERADAAPGLDDAGALELGVDPGDGVGVDPQVDGQLADGRQLVARPQPAGGDGGTQPAFELGIDRRGVVRVDGHEVHGADCTWSLLQVKRC